VPVGLAVILLGRRFIPESTLQKANRLDLTGMLLSALAIVLIVFPLHEGHLHHCHCGASPCSPQDSSSSVSSCATAAQAGQRTLGTCPSSGVGSSPAAWPRS